MIFLTLYIDLIGFSIVFPLMPDLLDHYLNVDGHSGLLGSMLSLTDSAASYLHKDHNFTEVLFGGIVSSVFSMLQFVFAPIWGNFSDRKGRRPVLLWTVAGTSLGYLIWMLSGSFWLFVLSRLVCGAFGGNLSVATAAVADVTSREERSKAMGLVGAAFGLGLVTGPAIGALAVRWNPVASFPALANIGIHPFSFPAFLALFISLINLLWIGARFKESLDPAHRADNQVDRPRNALKAIFALERRSVRQINLVAFLFSVAFVAMEMTLTYLAAERFHYTASQNGMLLAFLGVCSIVTQGMVVRKMLKTMSEIKVLGIGLALAAMGLVFIGVASQTWMLYGALVFTALGSGLVNPSSTGLISLYSDPNEQGRVLGVFRSLGALSRAITPIIAGAIYWSCGSLTVYLASAALALWALFMGLSLPKPSK